MNKKLGYYKVANKFETESKVQACILATNIAKSNPNIDPRKLVTWDFNDKEFESHDWTIVPEESLDELYNARARQLREKYDYISISYSAGADSHNIVMSFLRQNLHIDEIVVKTVSLADKYLSQSNINSTECVNTYYSERKLQIEPRLQEIAILSPNTKIKYYDASEEIINGFTQSDDPLWVLGVREELNPVDAMRYNYLKIPKFQNNLDKDKKVAIILGVDKARIELDYHTKMVYATFYDRGNNVVPIGNYMKEYTNTTIEYFYWAPECLRMLTKQAHVLKQWLEITPGFQAYFTYNYPQAYGHKITDTSWRLVNETLVKNIIYTTWNKSWFQSEKCTFDWFAEHDAWFYNGRKGTPEHQSWLKGIKYVMENAKPFLIDRNGIIDGFLRFKKIYPIGKLKDGILTT
jgi:hypothetical protein